MATDTRIDAGAEVARLTLRISYDADLDEVVP